MVSITPFESNFCLCRYAPAAARSGAASATTTTSTVAAASSSSPAWSTPASSRTTTSNTPYNNDEYYPTPPRQDPILTPYSYIFYRYSIADLRPRLNAAVKSCLDQTGQRIQWIYSGNSCGAQVGAIFICVMFIAKDPARRIFDIALTFKKCLLKQYAIGITASAS